MLRFIAALALVASPAFSQAPQCAPHAEATAMLQERYGESVVVMGLTRQGLLVELYAGATGGWTLLFITPDGQACLGADGYELQSVYTAPGVAG